MGDFFDESMKIVTLLAPSTDNISDPVVQVYFRKRIWGTCKKWQKSSDKDIEIVKILASLTGNPNAPNYFGITPIHCAVNNGHTEIVKYLASLNMRK